MPFYRKAHWSKVRVTVHSGREEVFAGETPIAYPCRSAYAADNETIEGIRRSLAEFNDEQKEGAGEGESGPPP